jgi:hypothetical protein
LKSATFSNAPNLAAASWSACPAIALATVDGG